MTRPFSLVLILALACVAILPGLIAQDSRPASRDESRSVADAAITDLAWIAGTWRTKQGDDALEEQWGLPLANAMTGMFRWQRGEAIWLYEFMLIEQTEDGIQFHLRHYGPGSKGWETKDEPLSSSLIELSENRAVFENPERTNARRFIFERDGDQFSITVESIEDGKTTRNAFTYTRAA